MPEAPRAAAAAVKPTPYGINTVHQPGYVPMAGAAGFDDGLSEPVRPISNKLAWLTLILGAASLASTFANLVPASEVIYLSGGGVLAVLVGVSALLRRVQKRATNVWAPILGILLGLSTVAVSLFGISLVDVVNTVTGNPSPASKTTITTNATPDRPFSPEPFVFASNPALTEDGSAVQQIATALNQNYAAGSSTLGAGQGWPQSLKFTATQVLADSGTPLATLPTGLAFVYTLSPDGTSYTFAVSSLANRAESAIYNSATNHFTFACPASDTTCTPVH